MSFDELEKSTRGRTAVALASLGVASGIASGVTGLETFKLDALHPVAVLFGLAPELLPIGVYFGIALGLGLWGYTGRLVVIPMVLITTLYAWSAAIQVAIRLQRNAGDDPHLVAASVSAGAVGAGLTHVGCAFIAPSLRRPLGILLTAIVGAVAGLLFYMGERQIIDGRLLYVIWQPAVAFCIGLGLQRETQSI